MGSEDVISTNHTIAISTADSTVVSTYKQNENTYKYFLYVISTYIFAKYIISTVLHMPHTTAQAVAPIHFAKTYPSRSTNLQSNNGPIPRGP